MNGIDLALQRLLNSNFGQYHDKIYKLMVLVASNTLIKGAVIMSIIYYLWFKNDSNQQKYRETILATLCGTFTAMFFARVLIKILPFRYRPMFDVAVNFVIPNGVKDVMIENSSSFPSDHAVLFYALGFGLLYASRKWGILSLLYITIFIAFPRFYLGFHHLTDLLCGGLIGIVFVTVSQSKLIKSKIASPVLKFENSKPHLFYVIFFLITYLIVDMFDGIRSLISGLLKI